MPSSGSTQSSRSRFVFRLSPVLEQRQRREDEHRRIVAGLERERLAVEDKLRGLQQEIEQARAQQRALLGSAQRQAAGAMKVPVENVRQQAGASMAITARAHAAALELAGTLRRLESARAELMQAVADRKAVELLRQRQHEQWLAERNRRDILELDEIGRNLTARERAQT